MAQVALSDYAPRRGLRAGPPLPRSSAVRDRPNRNNIAASLLLHLLVLLGIFLVPATPPEEVIVPVVTLRLGEGGAAGAAGGKAGGGGGGGHGPEASSAPTEAKPAETARQTEDALPEPPIPPEPAPPEPTLPEPIPPEPTPPTPDQASPLPPAPEALAPKPKPHPRPPAKPHVTKPKPPPVPVKRVEPPTPPAAPVVASEPPPGPANGQGPPTQIPQAGTAATGTASAGPGGATGVGTGAAGAGRGAFGNGKGNGDDYLERLYRHLLKYKRTPPDAVAKRQEGTVHITMVIARNGTVLDAQVSGSSGFPLLDQAILDMVHSASPVPPLPPEVPGDTAKVGLPFTFRIGLLDRIFR